MNLKFLMIAVLVAECFSAHSATVRLYFVDPLTNEKDTNAFYVTPIGTNVLSNGGVVGRGVTTRYVPASNGYKTNTLAVGHYSITNRSLGSGVVIRVPDSSSLYDYTNLLISGYNIFVTVTNGEGGGTSGALTNNETRAVTFESTLTIGGGSSQNPIAPSAGQLTFANSILVDGAFIQGRTIIGTNFVGNGAGLTNLPDVATQSGLAAGAYSVAGNHANATNYNSTNLVSPVEGVMIVGHNFALETTNGSNPGTIIFNSTAHGAGRGVVILGGNQGDVVINPNTDIIAPASSAGIFQIGRTGNAGSYQYVQYATMPSPSSPLGFSHPFEFRARGTNVASADSFLYSYPGVVGYIDDVSGSEKGRLSFYARVPHWNQNNVDPNAPDVAGTKVLDVGTNGIVASSGVDFKGSGAGITNENYAVFQRTYFNNVGQTVLPATTWTNVTFTTNIFAGQNFDSASAFTQSNSFLVVNAAGAGKWRVRASVPFYDNSTAAGNASTRLRKFNGTPATIMPGQATYQTAFVVTYSHLSGVVTLAAGDVIALQAFASSATWEIGKLNYGGFSDYVTTAFIEFERQ